MRTDEKTPAQDAPDCKADPAARQYSRPWMAGLVRDAGATADLRGACARAEISLVELRVYRTKDPEFDAAMGEVDQSIRLAALEAIRLNAALGDPKAIRLLTDGTAERLVLGARVEFGEGPTPDQDYAAYVAAIGDLFDLGKYEYETGKKVYSATCPECGSVFQAAIAREPRHGLDEPGFSALHPARRREVLAAHIADLQAQIPPLEKQLREVAEH